MNSGNTTHYREQVAKELQLNSTQNLAGYLCISLSLCAALPPQLPIHPYRLETTQRSLPSSQSTPDKRPVPCPIMLRNGTPLGPAAWPHRQDVWLSRHTMRQPVRDNKRLCNSKGPARLLSCSLLIICPTP